MTRHSLLLQQLQLFWVGFAQSFGVCLQEFLTILPEPHLKSQPLMLDEKAWFAVFTLIYPQNSVGFNSAKFFTFKPTV